MSASSKIARSIHVPRKILAIRCAIDVAWQVISYSPRTLPILSEIAGFKLPVEKSLAEAFSLVRSFNYLLVDDDFAIQLG